MKLYHCAFSNNTGTGSPNFSARIYSFLPERAQSVCMYMCELQRPCTATYVDAKAMWKVPLIIQSQEIQNWANFLSWFHPIVLKYCKHLRTAGDLTASSVPRGSLNWLKWEISQKQDNNEFWETTKEEVFLKYWY